MGSRQLTRTLLLPARLALRAVRALAARIASALEVMIPLLFIAASVFYPRHRTHLVWGPTPLTNNRFWSEAMKQAGWTSVTLMTHRYAIHAADDFDMYFSDLVPAWLGGGRFDAAFRRSFAFLFVMRNARVLHISFTGAMLGDTWLWRMELWAYRRAEIKIIVIPYGGDAYQYSAITDLPLRYALLRSYPAAATWEARIKSRVQYFARHADIFFCGNILFGMPRWDVVTPNPFCFDVNLVQKREQYGAADGINQAVSIIHTPNHRGFKGTEFLVEAVRQLKGEGLKIELVVLEGTKNTEVLEEMGRCDILAEQFVAGYALSAIEGMAAGIPVVANLENDDYFRVFRRYSFMGECPIVSAAPENLADVLRRLIRDPELRATLGRAGRLYAEKYHSYAAAQRLFGAIYRKLLQGEEVDLMTLYHPLTGAGKNGVEQVRHPLRDSRLPEPARICDHQPSEIAR